MKTTIERGKTQASMMNPPNEGTVLDAGKEWRIGRNGSGLIVLRSEVGPHPDFLEGMDMMSFVCWINCA